jgi:phosphoribosyl 1,2-cyclic phosphate phosphodiesterase
MSRSFTFLGTGTSVGVPMVGCDCDVCRSADPRNHRFRCSVLIRLPEGNLLIDTPPELRLQLIRERVNLVHAVLLTHYHADHLFGLDDLRPIPKLLGGPVPLYCHEDTEAVIRRAFSYAFRPETEALPAGYVPQLTLNRLDGRPFTVLGHRIVPVPLVHAHYHVYGFRIDDVAYCTDVNHIPSASWPLLEGVRILVLDTLRFRPHPAHFSLDEALEVIARLRPRKAYLTHISHDVDHDATQRLLPSNVEIAHDGLRFEF